MELVAGEDSRRRLDREGALSHDDSWRIALAVAEALAHAHARGVVHRDVKPQNVLLAGQTVKLTDFGMARVESLAGMTGSSLVWGSPEYMAPELFGQGGVDPRTDLYSLGVLLFEMVSGRLPWKEGRALGGSSGRAGPRNRCHPSVRARPSITSWRRCCSTSPDDRPSSAAEVIAVLRGEAPAVALLRTVRCNSCGEARPDDIPRCPACGREAALVPRAGGGKWRVVVTSVREDADSMAALTRLVGDLTVARISISSFEPVGKSSTATRRSVARSSFRRSSLRISTRRTPRRSPSRSRAPACARSRRRDGSSTA